MTDEQIMNTDPFSLEGSEVTEESVAPVETEETSPETPEETGGADHSASGDEEETVDTDVDEQDDSDDTEKAVSGNEPFSTEANQASDTEKDTESADDSEPGEIDYKSAYEELLSPFRAARREVKVDNIEDARRLMQQGVDYSNKMRQMKPHLRVLRTLEKAGLTDPEQINFLIDLKEGKKDAIKKLLKDGSIDPMDLDLEGSETYKPTEHIMDDTELNITEAFDTISQSPKYQETLNTIDGMDTVSKQQLQANPSVIPIINQHIEAGVYETVWAKVEMERMLGRLPGLSDLDAYYAVGEAMNKAGAFGAPASSPSTAAETAQSPAQGGSPASKTAEKQKDLKRAASPTKGRAAQAGKKVPDFAKMSDADIENLDISTLL
jgi:hypothetical protein